MLRQRIVTAVILLAILGAAAASGRQVLDAVLAVLLGAAAFEWLRLAQATSVLAVGAGCAFAAALFALEESASWPGGDELAALFAAASIAWLLIAVLVLRGARRGARLSHRVSAAVAFLLLGAAWFSLMRLMDSGFAYLLSLMAIVWVADIAAYFVGRKWGRTKLAPAISPGKTWAGVAGAVAAVLAIAVLVDLLAPQLPVFSTLLQQRLPLPLALAVLVGLVALSIVGDLFESLLKRQVGAKDSSALLPGHGGVLDRVDALLAVLPASALIDLWLRG